MGGGKEMPMDNIKVISALESSFWPWNTFGKGIQYAGGKGNNKVKTSLGQQIYSWVSAGPSSNEPGLENVWPECWAIPELEIMLLVQLSVHLHKQFSCVFFLECSSWGLFI